MPTEGLMHVGVWVNDLAAVACLGAGLAAFVLTLLPGKKLEGKADGKDPSAFIDPGAGETARYRLAFKDLINEKNSSMDVTQISQARVDVAETTIEQGKTNAASASALALTMFDRGVLGPGVLSENATKQLSRTNIESSKNASTKVLKKKGDSKQTEVNKIAPKKDEPKRPEPRNDAVRKVAPKKTTATELPTPPVSVEESSASEGLLSQGAGTAPGAGVPPVQFFPQDSFQQHSVGSNSFIQTPSQATNSSPTNPQQAEPVIEPVSTQDPNKDPRKVGRSTLIEPKENLQKRDNPPPPEHLK